MICILLIHFQVFTNADNSLQYFGQRRTDRKVSKKQFQGVETASQIRYVNYFERLQLWGIKYPEPKWLFLEEIRITGERSSLCHCRTIVRLVLCVLP
jgi:PTEN phosphatase family protein